MTELPRPRERRTAKVVIYLTPAERNYLAYLARMGDMSVSELGSQTLRETLLNDHLIGVSSEEPIPPG